MAKLTKLRIVFKSGSEVVVDVFDDYEILLEDGNIVSLKAASTRKSKERLKWVKFDEIVCVTEVK